MGSLSSSSRYSVIFSGRFTSIFSSVRCSLLDCCCWAWEVDCGNSFLSLFYSFLAFSAKYSSQLPIGFNVGVSSSM